MCEEVCGKKLQGLQEVPSGGLFPKERPPKVKPKLIFINIIIIIFK